MEIVYKTEYVSFKQELDKELNKAADGFVKIGYLLRQAEDTDVLESSGYRNVAEFASVEYGLSKDIVSRYININKRFSEGGYSDTLAERYRGFGMAKLAEMLTLPPALADAIPDAISKTELREIKKEYETEQSISDIEVAIEAAVQETLNDETMIMRIVKQWLHDVPDSFKRCVDTISEPAYDIEDLKNVVAPAGTNVIITRLAGLGKYMMTCQIDNNIDIVNMRTSEREKRTWPDMYQCIKSICKKISESETYEDIWMRIYSESYPVPQNVESGDNSEEKPTQKPEQKRKTSKVTVTKKKPAIKKTHIGEKDNIVAPAQPVQHEHELSHQHNDTENESRNIEPYIEMMNDLYNKCVAMLRINDTDKADNFMQLLHDEFNKLKNAIKGGKENDISV